MFLLFIDTNKRFYLIKVVGLVHLINLGLNFASDS